VYGGCERGLLPLDQQPRDIERCGESLPALRGRRSPERYRDILRFKCERLKRRGVFVRRRRPKGKHRLRPDGKNLIENCVFRHPLRTPFAAPYFAPTAATAPPTQQFAPRQ